MIESNYLFNAYARINLRFKKGNGAWLITEDGDRYLDFASGIAVNSLGHCHPKLVKALIKQAETLWHTSNLYQSTEQEQLAALLAQKTFADKIFFTNSGVEAVECAVKTARRYHYTRNEPHKFRIITFEKAFHGRTLAAISANGQSKYLQGFEPKVPGFDQVPLNDLKSLQKMITRETAAILIEPIQGDGGINEATKDFLENIRKICDENGLLLIFDEVQTGVGRTGKLFAYEWSNVKPDIMAIAKGLGGGFPIGACLATNTASSGMTPGSHGSTYGGNPLAMAVGKQVLTIILEKGFLERVCNIADVFYKELILIKNCFPNVIEEVRGKGLMLGLKISGDAKEFIKTLREEQLLVAPAGNDVLRLLPPLIISLEELHEGLARISRAALIFSNNQKT
ncbi:Acetylornithine aminotransferase [Liberibacter crescens BT-1]|uniref:Acetylornithine aminotransferase n=1 Tax=Liberibacter crescens (strain BT-1) TaxID=1215343 RepID=L0EU15_LIBCB|nr:aspartate aminotransferase family protein [Liberibacter crescens]AGA64143.1 Acetylornithine aminotransferase [Liberibacter crescens BT-1]AMC12412.1 acetylornithine aminotransferase [Liberibacter crescens]